MLSLRSYLPNLMSEFFIFFLEALNDFKIKFKKMFNKHTESTIEEDQNGDMTGNLKLLIVEVGSNKFKLLLDNPNVIKPFGWIYFL